MAVSPPFLMKCVFDDKQAVVTLESDLNKNHVPSEGVG